MILTPAEILTGPDTGKYRMLAVVPKSHAHPAGYCAELHAHETKLEACQCYIQYCIDTKLVVESGPEAYCCVTGKLTTTWVNIGIFLKAVAPEIVDKKEWDRVFKIKDPFIVTQESELKKIEP